MHTLARAAAWSLLAAWLGALAAACAGTSLPPAQQSGAQLYVSQGCHRCHARDGSGGWFGLGPDLRDKRPHWSVPALASYLADPAAWAADDPRLGARSMPAFGHLDAATRERLAEHVLALMQPAPGG